MKRLLVLIFFGLAIAAYAHESSTVNYGQATGSGTFDLIWVYDLVTSGPNTVAVITGVKNSAGTANPIGAVEVPESIVHSNGSGYPVRKIASTAFNFQIGITSISIPKNITEIEPGAFYGCDMLESITVDPGCKRYTSIEGILYNYKQTELVACPACIETVLLPPALDTIDDLAFAGCFLLSSINLPEGVNEIGDYAFMDCPDLVSLVFVGDAPDYVGSDIFYNSGIEKIIVNEEASGWNDSWEGIAVETANGDTATDIVTGQADGVIWSYRIVNGISAELVGKNGSACIGKNVSSTMHFDELEGRYVNDNALIIPATLGNYPVTSIGSNAFKGCAALTTVVLPNSVTAIGDNAFQDCTGITSLSFPDTIRSIGRHPVAGSSITALALPSSLRELDGNPMAGCDTVLSVTIDPDNSYYTVVDGLLYDKDVKELVGCPARKETATIAASVTRIGDGAFLGCFRISTLSIPEKAASIGAKAFSGCSNLTGVTFLGDAPQADDDIYANSTGVTTSAYSDKSGWSGTIWKNRPLNVITVGGGSSADDPVGPQSFTDSSGVEWLYTVENGLAVLGLWGETPVVSNPGGITQLTVPENLGGYPLSTIPDNAFADMTALREVRIPASITTIAASAFNGCTALEELWVDGANPAYSSKYRCLYSKDGKSLLKVPATFEFAKTITRTATETRQNLRVTNQYFDMNMVLHPTVTNALSDAVTDVKTSSEVSTPAITSEMLFENVKTIGDFAFTDCGFVEVPANEEIAEVVSSFVQPLDGHTVTDIVLLEGSATYALDEKLVIPGTVTSVAANAFYNNGFTDIIDHSSGPVIASLADLATEFGTYDPGLIAEIDTQAELDDFNAFLREVGISAASELTDSQKSHLLDSYNVSAVTPDPVLLVADPVVTIDYLAQELDSNNTDLRVVFTSGGEDILMSKEKIRNMLWVGASPSAITERPKILASPDVDGSTVYFVVTAPDSLSGSPSLFFQVRISR